MTEQEKLELLEETMDTQEGVLAPDTLLSDVEEYDSMAKLAIIVMFEDEFDKKIDGSLIRSFKTVGDILAEMN